MTIYRIFIFICPKSNINEIEFQLFIRKLFIFDIQNEYLLVLLELGIQSVPVTMT